VLYVYDTTGMAFHAQLAFDYCGQINCSELVNIEYSSLQIYFTPTVLYNVNVSLIFA